MRPAMIVPLPRPSAPSSGADYYRERSRADNTRRTYDSAQRQFEAWCRGRHLASLPATPDDIANFLSQIATEGASVSTVRVTRAAIAHAHVAAGFDDPTQDDAVRVCVKGIARTHGSAPQQARPLLESDAQAIVEAAERERWDGWRLDLALIGVMRDGMLRRAETAALTWDDVLPATDGSGVVAIRRAKADQEGAGDMRYLRAETMRRVRAWKDDPARRRQRHLVFGVGARSICRRIQRAAQRAGLEGAYSGHSPRIGMAVDLAEAGVALPELMEAGRWKSATVAARYVAAQAARRGAVAKVFGEEA